MWNIILFLYVLPVSRRNNKKKENENRLTIPNERVGQEIDWSKINRQRIEVYNFCSHHDPVFMLGFFVCVCVCASAIGQCSAGWTWQRLTPKAAGSRAISKGKVVKQAGMLLLGPVRFSSGWEVKWQQRGFPLKEKTEWNREKMNKREFNNCGIGGKRARVRQNRIRLNR